VGDIVAAFETVLRVLGVRRVLGVPCQGARGARGARVLRVLKGAKGAKGA